MLESLYGPDWSDVLGAQSISFIREDKQNQLKNNLARFLAISLPLTNSCISVYTEGSVSVLFVFMSTLVCLLTWILAVCVTISSCYPDKLYLTSCKKWLAF